MKTTTRVKDGANDYSKWCLQNTGTYRESMKNAFLNVNEQKKTACLRGF
jgi:hypothetical protein